MDKQALTPRENNELVYNRFRKRFAIQSVEKSVDPALQVIYETFLLRLWNLFINNDSTEGAEMPFTGVVCFR